MQPVQPEQPVIINLEFDDNDDTNTPKSDDEIIVMSKLDDSKIVPISAQTNHESQQVDTTDGGKMVNSNSGGQQNINETDVNKGIYIN